MSRTPVVRTAARLTVAFALTSLTLAAHVDARPVSHTATPIKETEWPRTPVKTFRDHHHVKGLGQIIQPKQTVLVSCRVFDPSIPSVSPAGYWYRIASAPWRNQYWAPANTFLNGDPMNGPYRRAVDRRVPLCT
jgi:hypothetical protein